MLSHKPGSIANSTALNSAQKRGFALFANRMEHGAFPTLRYGLAIAATAAALLVRWAFNPVLDATVPWITLLPAIGFAALYLGMGPALVSLGLGMLGVNYFISPLQGIALPQLNGATTLAFIVGSALLIFFGESRRRNLLQLHRSQAEISKAKLELERKVEERTAELRRLSARVLQVRDEERRHIARELHDSTGQLLSAIKLTAGSLRRVVPKSPEADDLLSDISALAYQASEEIRTMSYLLHPPLLDELGFSSAAKWYIQGFSKRSGITAKADLPPFRLSQDEGLVFFRVLQESLTNVLRHSGSKSVEITLELCGGNFALSVRDHGKGIPSEKLLGFDDRFAGSGVGLTGMQERLRILGGHLKIRSDGTGTCVIATLPITQTTQPAHHPETVAAAAPQTSPAISVDWAAIPAETK